MDAPGSPESLAPAAPPLMARRFRQFLPVVIDVETGGFNCATDALLEICAVMIQFGFSPEALFARAVEVKTQIAAATGLDPAAAGTKGLSIMGPGTFLTDPVSAISFGMAPMFGTAGLQVTTSFLTTYSGAAWIWNVQTAAVVLGHVLAVIVAHAVALREIGDPLRARLFEVSLAVLMIGYTVLGLWLLSTPVVG